MTGAGKKSAPNRKFRQPEQERPGKTDGSLGDTEFERLKRPVNSDAFLVDRPLSPEEEGLAGPLPDEDEEPKSGE